MQALTAPKTENKKFLFLLIGPWDKRFEDLGALIYRDIDRAILDLDHVSFYVLALSVTNLLSRSFPSFYETLQKKQNKIKTVLILPKDFDLQKSISLLQKYPFHGVIESQNDPEVESVLMSTLELARTEEQKDMFTKLASDESESLKKFSEELELRVEKRTKFLTEARRKSFLSNLKNEAFKKVLTFIHEATDAESLEIRLNNVLLNVVEVAWIKICTAKEEIEFEDKLKKEFNYQYLKIPLYEDDVKSIGSLFFMRQENFKFSKEDHEFLNKIAEFVALALGKIKKLQELGAAKEIWQSTFQAISEP
ncbi:MAG TPA: hypothetical protein PLJ21_04625, partial [Pseudobdellovibrionaceae bacterium]|nr:hypothetical protein [Pseudobdellovibrionaceae bacterium]